MILGIIDKDALLKVGSLPAGPHAVEVLLVKQECRSISGSGVKILYCQYCATRTA